MRPLKAPPPPPSPRIIAAFRDALRNCLTLEIAATMCKIPQATLLKWIEWGRRGAVEYMPFVEMLDEERAKLSESVLEFLYNAAFNERSLDAVKFLYKHRLQADEERFQARLHAIEDRLQEEVVDKLDSTAEEADLAAAEARLASH